jgi:competence protein ComEA
MALNSSGAEAGGSLSSPAGEARRLGRRTVVSSDKAVIYVAGAVAKPGVYSLPPADRAVDALRAAGGATSQGDLVAINLAAHIEDGEEIAVPVRGASGESEGGAYAKPRRARRHPAKRGRRRKHHVAAFGSSLDGGNDAGDAGNGADAPLETVDVNSADEAELEALPGIGPSLAQRIVAFRDLNGPFASIDELLDVGGMTSGKVDALSPYVTFR